VYWDDDCTIDTLYVIMCMPVKTGCQDFYFENYYMDKYIDMCLPDCKDLYFDEDYSLKTYRMVDMCLADTSTDQDVHNQLPGV
jgi:hypothetical protein